ncbi:MAG: hypothetical protein IJP38_09070, partial [Oscillospiraceae bacterium]|nr:hypothetical protein [Oscillospiraceae bacterium]
SFKINVPASGKYKVSLNHYQMVAGATTKGGYGNVYLLPGNTADIEAALETAVPLNGDTEVAYASSEITAAATPKTVLREEYEIEKGEYILVFKATRKHPDCHSEAGTYPISFVLEGDAAEKAYAGAVALENNELTKGSSTTATIALYNTEDGSEITDGAEFASSNTNVVKVSGNTLTAVGVGTAEITADYSGDISNGNIVSAKVTVVDTTDDSVIFGKATNVDSKIEIDGTLRRGDTVTLTADDIEGYNFIGWKRGNAKTGKFIVDAPQKDFAFKVYSNAFVTAIYEKTDEESATGVEFWNKNGELVAEYTADEFAALSKLPEASLIGHTFEGWQTEDEEEFTLNSSLANGITRVIAKQEPISISGPFVCDDVTTELDENAMPFNSPITASTTSTTFSCWLRNEMVVSYDKDYTYYVWSAADINNSKIDVPDDKKPIVILEEGYGAYMIEFDDADYTIVEAGIIAGNGTPTVSSAPEKHIAQKIGSHGQFAVKLSEDYENVRGYVIYIDGTTFKIAYSD